MSDASDCNVDCGTPPSGTVAAEDGTIKVTSSNIDFSRDFTDYTDDDGCVYAVRGKNPKASIEFDAEIIGTTGLAAMHVGEDLATFGESAMTLANYATTMRGFDPSDGCIYLESASNTATDEAPTTSMTFIHAPHVV